MPVEFISLDKLLDFLAEYMPFAKGETQIEFSSRFLQKDPSDGAERHEFSYNVFFSSNPNRTYPDMKLTEEVKFERYDSVDKEKMLTFADLVTELEDHYNVTKEGERIKIESQLSKEEKQKIHENLTKSVPVFAVVDGFNKTLDVDVKKDFVSFCGGRKYEDIYNTFLNLEKAIIPLLATRSGEYKIAPEVTYAVVSRLKKS